MLILKTSKLPLWRCTLVYWGGSNRVWKRHFVATSRPIRSRHDMKFQSIPVSAADNAEGNADAEVVMLKVSGPVDPDDEVLQRARQLVLGTGSQEMIESFDWAVRQGGFAAEG